MAAIAGSHSFLLATGTDRPGLLGEGHQQEGPAAGGAGSLQH